MSSSQPEDHQRERDEMVDRQIVRRGVRSERVLAAMRRVPRHEFVPGGQRHQAYEDHPLPIGDSQTISQPYMVAAMTELLELEPDSRVLEVGTGSGYQAAILAELAAEVYTIERFPRLAARARTTLTALGYDNVFYRVADGTRGWPEVAPFDGIVVTAAAPEVPPSLLSQLGDPGVLVAPVGASRIQDLVSVRRKDGRDRRTVHFRCAFVPLVGVEGFPD
jgi:protein-L-isoaspartate(D-aspartate) O-methyltransferase